MSQLRVRPMEAPDGDVVETIARESGLVLDLDGERSKPWTLLWVAEFPGQEPIAYLLSWKVADELELVQLATRPGERRRGAARGLLVALTGWAKEQGISAVFLEVRRSNEPARRLYDSLGFAVTRVRPRYYSDGEDAVEMRHSPS